MVRERQKGGTESMFGVEQGQPRLCKPSLVRGREDLADVGWSRGDRAGESKTHVK